MSRSHGLRLASPCDLACRACDRSPSGASLPEALAELERLSPRPGDELRILGCDPLGLASLPRLAEVARARGFSRVLLETNGAALGEAELDGIDELIVPELLIPSDEADRYFGKPGAWRRLRRGLERFSGSVRLRVPLLAPGLQEPLRFLPELARVAAIEPYVPHGSLARELEPSLEALLAAARTLGTPCVVLPHSGITLPERPAELPRVSAKRRFRVVLANLVERSFGYGPGAAEYLRAALLSAPDLRDRVEVEVAHYVNVPAHEASQRLLALDPDLLGMSTYSWNLGENTRVCRELRCLGARFPIVWGGPSFALFSHDASWFEAWDLVDAVAIGSGEQTAVGLVRELLARGKLERALPGLALQSEGRVCFGPPTEEPASLDELASPFQLGVAHRVERPTLEMARGCIFDCGFCSDARSSRGGGLREHSRERIAADIAAITRWPEARFVDAGASTANVSEEFFVRVCDAIRQGDPEQRLEYGFQLYPSLASSVQRAALEGVRASVLHLGVQSLTRATFRPMRRGSRHELVERAITTFRGVAPLELSVILGLPGETYASFVRGFESLLSLSGARLVVNRLLVLPGTAFHLRRRELGLELDAERYFRLLSTPSMTRGDLSRAQAYVIERALALPDRFVDGDARVRWVNFDVQKRFGDPPEYG